MYFGESATVLDDKSRITVPRRVRETMDYEGHLQWFMTRGFDGAIFMFPRPEWDKIREGAKRFASMDARALDFRRLFFGSVAEARPDKQGRIPVPQHLREHAGLDREAVLIGADDHLELWSRENWKQYQERKEAEYRDMASFMFTGDVTASPVTGTTAGV